MEQTEKKDQTIEETERTYGLNERAMLVALNISQWTGRKYDREISREVEEQHQATDAGRYNKILSNSPTLKAIQKLSGVVRQYHYERTLPWAQDGTRIIPASLYYQYIEKMREFEDQFDRLVFDLLEAWDQILVEEEQRLNGMFKASEYPTRDRLKKKFSFDVTFFPMPDAKDFRVDLGTREIEKIQDAVRAKIYDAQKGIVADLYERIRETVGHVRDKLSSPDAIFRDSLVGNLADLVTLLPRLNVMDDPGLTRITREIEDRLTGIDAETLRKDKATRAQVAKDADEILASLGAVLA